MDFNDLSFLDRLQCFCIAFPVLFAVFWTWIGACIGSFLNVCVWRIPNGMSILTPPSHCPNCNHRIPFYENVPILSWLILRGKCSKCHCKISPRYIIVEALTAIVFLAIWKSYEPLLPGTDAALFFTELLVAFFFAGILIASAFTDCDYHIIPDAFPLTFAIVSVLFGILNVVFVFGADLRTFAMVVGFPLLNAIGFLLLFALFAGLGKRMTGKTVLGWGDVKLLAAMALFFPVKMMLFTVICACILMLILAPIYRKVKPKMRHRGIPFAPALAIASAITFFLHDEVAFLLEKVFPHI